MSKDGERRIATEQGAMLVDPACVERSALQDAALESLFDPAYWAGRGQLAEVSGGRGAAWFVGEPPRQWVLRHYRRGGFVARLSSDAYVWAGEERVRAFAEWRLLGELRRRGLPVPQPVAARYRRSGPLYRCDLVTLRLNHVSPLSDVLSQGALTELGWRAVGATVAWLHAAGAYHADLNAHNILIGSDWAVSVIDFDRGSLRPPGAWAARNLKRLHRSLHKIARHLPPQRFSQAAWAWLRAGYAGELGRAHEPGSAREPGSADET